MLSLSQRVIFNIIISLLHPPPKKWSIKMQKMVQLQSSCANKMFTITLGFAMFFMNYLFSTEPSMCHPKKLSFDAKREGSLLHVENN